MDKETRRQKLLLPTGQLHVVIDTDAQNEVDDQFAIAWALKSPERITVDAIYAAPFSYDCFAKLYRAVGIEHSVAPVTPAEGMERSYAEILNVCRLTDPDSKIPTYRGAEHYLQNGEPVYSEAVQDLIARARSASETLYVAACGVLTNIASAILAAPDIIDHIVVIWLGGQPPEYEHAIEFNSMQDIAAARIVFDSGVPLIVIPCMSVASAMNATESELREHLQGRNAICDYLYQIVEHEFHDIDAQIAMMQLDRYGYLKGQEDCPEEYLAQYETAHISWSRTLWDVAVTAYLRNPNWLPSHLVHAPVLHDDLTVTIDPTRHEIRQVTYCWRDFIYGQMFYDLVR